MGCVSEADIRCFEPEKTLAHYQHAFEGFFVRNNANWLDILESFALYQTNIMPVLDGENSYLG